MKRLRRSCVQCFHGRSDYIVARCQGKCVVIYGLTCVFCAWVLIGRRASVSSITWKKCFQFQINIQESMTTSLTTLLINRTDEHCAKALVILKAVSHESADAVNFHWNRPRRFPHFLFRLKQPSCVFPVFFKPRRVLDSYWSAANLKQQAIEWCVFVNEHKINWNFYTRIRGSIKKCYTKKREKSKPWTKKTLAKSILVA